MTDFLYGDFMNLVDIIVSLSNGQQGLEQKFVDAKAYWVKLVKNINFAERLQVMDLKALIDAAQDEFTHIAGGDRELGKVLMGATFVLPFYQEGRGFSRSDLRKALQVYRLIKSSNVLSLEVKQQAKQTCIIFGFPMKSK